MNQPNGATTGTPRIETKRVAKSVTFFCAYICKNSKSCPQSNVQIPNGDGVVANAFLTPRPKHNGRGISSNQRKPSRNGID